MLHDEFSKIMKCSKCSTLTSRKLIRDQFENIPQPGFVGKNYNNKKVVLVGQNPGVCPPAYAKADAIYTASLRAVRDNPKDETMDNLYPILLNSVSSWKVQEYFPLNESGLSLQDIAYFNVVRCRTQSNSAPGKNVVGNCLLHFENWISFFSPAVVVFIGKIGF